MANTKDFSDLFKQTGTRKRLLVTFPNISVTLRDEDIVSESMEISESLCSGPELRFGSCEASVFKLRIIGNVIPLIGEICTVSMYVGDIAEPFVFGTYKVASDKPTADRRYRDIVAYDAMYDIINADVAEWYNTILPNANSTTTLGAFRASFVANFGLEQEEITLPNDEMVVTKTIDPGELSGKDVLPAICELNGCFGHIGRNGKMQYITLQEIVGGAYPVDEISAEHYISCKYEDYTTKHIGKLQIRQEENDIGCIVGEGENSYIIENNFLVYGKNTAELEAVAQKVFDIISVVSYRPASAKAIGNPCLEVGAGIRMVTQHETVETYILERTLKGIQALLDSYEANGSETYSKNINSAQNIIIQLKGKTNLLIRTLEETKSEISDLEKYTSSSIQQLAGQITLCVTAGDVESMIEVAVGEITIDAEQINLNGYVKSGGGNFTIDENGNWKVVGTTYEVEAADGGIRVTGRSDLGNWKAHYGASGIVFWYMNKRVARLAVNDEGQLELAYYDGDEAKNGIILTDTTLKLPLNDERVKVDYTTFGNINIMKAEGYQEEDEEKAMYGNIASVGWTRGKVETLRKEMTERLEELQEWVDANTTDIGVAEANINTLFDNVDTLFELVSQGGGGGGGGEVAYGAGAHNSVYRGNYLGNQVTEAQYAAIANGTFADLFIGDYWTIDGVNYRIAAFDYYFQRGDVPCTTHHAVIVPDFPLYDHAMNDSDTVVGAYVGSKMYRSGLTEAKSTILSAFGSNHILNHRNYLKNAVNGNYESGGSYYDSTVELMTEQNVYGGKFFGNVSNGTETPYNHTMDNSQFPLFFYRPDMIFNGQSYWLRDVAAGFGFSNVDSFTSVIISSYLLGVRPSFSIIG